MVTNRIATYNAYPLIFTRLIVTFCDFLSNFRKNTTKTVLNPEMSLDYYAFFVTFLKNTTKTILNPEMFLNWYAF